MAINLTYSSASAERLLLVFRFPTSIEKGSAMLLGPGSHLTLNLYGCIRNTHFSMHVQGFDLGP